MSLSEQQDLFLRDVVKLLEEAWRMGFRVTGGELYRTKEQQEIYFNTGRSKTMNSKHLSRLAIDLNFFKDGQLAMGESSLRSLGEYWKSLSPTNEWGGDFTSIVRDEDGNEVVVSFYDGGHFQRNPI